MQFPKALSDVLIARSSRANCWDAATSSDHVKISGAPPSQVSDPARSTSESFARRTTVRVPAVPGVWAVDGGTSEAANWLHRAGSLFSSLPFSTDSTSSANCSTAWLRDECSFDRVARVARPLVPRATSASTSAADATWYSESPRTKTAPLDPRFEGASRTWSAGAFEGSGTNKSWTRSQINQ